MKKKAFLAVGLLSSLTAVSITAGFGLKSNQLGALGS